MSHTKIGLEERRAIAKWYGTVSVPQMAARLGRNKTSLYDEIRANGDVRAGASPGARFRQSDYTYDAEVAHPRACARRARTGVDGKSDELKSAALALLAKRRSPKQASMTLKQQGRPASHVWVHRLLVYLVATGVLPLSCRRRRGRKARAAVAPGGRAAIANRKSVACRPIEALLRSEPGHFEVDLMLGPRGSGVVLVAVDRMTRKMYVRRLRDRCSFRVSRAVVEMLRGTVVRTITSDNGGEFARHEAVSRRLGAGWYFCDPGDPGARGTVEHAIGRLRDYFPKGTPLPASCVRELALAADRINTGPMAVLGHETPDAYHWEMVDGAGLPLAA